MPGPGGGPGGGYPDVIAPPTFAIVVSAANSAQVTHDPDLGVNYAMVLHGEQSFSHARPLHAGDVVVSQSTIESIRRMGSMTTLTTVTQISDHGGRARVHRPVGARRTRRLGENDGQPQLRRRRRPGPRSRPGSTR